MKEFEVTINKELIDNIVPFDYDMRESVLSKALKDIQEQKGIIIRDKIRDLGISMDWDIEHRRRFKVISCDIQGDEERYYFNDGSEQGLRIVTFLKEPFDFPMNTEKMSHSINVGFSYY